jgi:putative membrane protein
MLLYADTALVQASLGTVILKVLLNALALFVAASFIKGVRVTNFTNAIVAALALALLNATLGAIIYALALPLRVMTLGLFTLVINAALIWIAAYFIKGFDVRGFLPALWLAVLTALFNTVLYAIFL